MMGDGYGGWSMGDATSGGWVTMTVVMVVLLVGLVALVVWTTGPSRRAPDVRVDRPDVSGPRHTLDERFARGEIDEDEYLPPQPARLRDRV